MKKCKNKKLPLLMVFLIFFLSLIPYKVFAVPIVDAVWPKDGLYTYGTWGQAGEISSFFGTTSKGSKREVYIDIGRNITFNSSNSVTIKANLGSATGHGQSSPWFEFFGSINSNMNAGYWSPEKGQVVPYLTNIITIPNTKNYVQCTIPGESINNTYRYFEFLATMENDPRIDSLEFIINSNDNQAPSLSLSLSPNSFTNNPVTIIATSSDNFGVSSIKTPDGNYTNNSTTSYTVNTNGTYTFVATDTSGNTTTQSITVNNIDTTVPTETSATILNKDENGYDVYVYGVSDSQSGVNRVQFPTWTESNGQDDIDSSWQTSSASMGQNLGNGTWKYHVYRTSHNGEYGSYITHIYVYDNAGNGTFVSGFQTTLDTTAPTLNLSQNTTSYTNGSIVITATASDTGSGVSSITLPNNSVINSSSTTYTVNANGTYTFKSTDKIGNVSSKTITINNIDTTAPTVTLKPSTTNATNGNVIITATSSDTGTSGFKNIKLPDGTYSTSTTSSYTATTNGTYTFIAYDNAGNATTQSININNIDKTAPTVTLTPSTTNATNGNVTITATSSDTGTSGFKNIKLPDDTYSTSATAPYTVTANGTYTFTVYDNAGNSTTQSININNIDKTAPIITIGSYNTNPTNQNITVTATTNEGTLNTSSHTFTSNGSFDFIATDNAGNKTTKTVTITNIDKTLPVITISVDSYNSSTHTLIVSATTSKGTLNATSHTFTADGSFDFVATDTLGNTATKRETITGLTSGTPSVVTTDITSGGSTNTATPITFTPSTTNPTNSNVTITINFPSYEVTKQYKIGTSGTWTNYTGAVTLSANDTIYAKATDSNGVLNQNILTVSNIDTTVPTLTLTQNITNATNGNVNITAIGADTGSGVKNIKLPNGTFVTGLTTTYTVSSNGTYSFVIYDNAGNSTTQNITINNIDTTAPTLVLTSSTTAWTKGSVLITATGSDSGSGVKSITKPDGTIVSGSSVTYSVNTSGVYNFVVTDNAGNNTPKSIAINNIDTTVPTLSLNTSTTDYTNGSIVITATGSDASSGVNYITKPDGTTVTGNSATYSVSTNGTYSFKVTDNAGNATTQSVTINNIDTTAPTLIATPKTTNWVSTLNAQKHTLRLSTYAFNNKEGAVTPATYLDGNVVQNLTRGLNLVAYDNNFNVVKNVSYDTYGNQSLCDNLANDINALPNGSLIVLQAYDAFNISNNLRTTLQNIGVPNATTMNTDADSGIANKNQRVTFQFAIYKGETTPLLFDYDRNGYTIADNTILVGNTGMYETISSTDTESKPNTIILPNGSRLYNNSLSLTNVTIKYLVYDNGTYTFKTTDSANNTNTKNVVVNNIDSVVPSLTLTQNITSYTNGSVTITASGSDNSSGVKSITKPDGTVVLGNSTNYSVSTNGTYTFVVTDNVGNSTTQSITISNIDTIAPILSLSLNTTAYTNGSVTITANGSDASSGVNYITKPDGTTVTGKSTTYSVSTNGTYSFKVTDNAGNVTTQSITVSNIDSIAPNLILTPNIATWTNGSVTITATGNDDLSNIKNIKTPDGTFITGNTTNYTVSANGIYNFTMYDNAGNSTTKSINVDNIKTTGSNLTISQSTSNWTNQNINLNAVFSDSLNTIKTIETPDGIKTRVHNKSPKILVIDWTTGYTPISSRLQTLGYNVTYDNTVTTLSQLSGYDVIIADQYAWAVTKGSLLNQAYAQGYRILTQGNDTTNTIEPITATISNTKSYKQKITALNEVTESIDITNTGDMDSGNIITGIADDAVSWSTQSDYPNSIGIVYAHNQKNGKWIHIQPIMSGSTFDEFYMSAIDELMTGSKFNTTAFNQTYNISSNGTYTFKVTDFAGNITTKNITVSNIDKTAPSLNLTQNTTNYTTNNVIITATATDAESGVSQIQLPNGTWVSGSNATYTVTSNGTYQFSVKDNVGNISTKSITISNIDKEAPTLTVSQDSAWTNGSSTINIKAVDTGSGVKQIILPNGSIISGDTATYTVSDVGVYYFEAIDNVGNIATKYIIVSNIDKNKPTVTITNNKNWSNANSENVTITATDN